MNKCLIIVLLILILLCCCCENKEHYGSDTLHRSMLKERNLENDWKPHPLFKPLEGIDSPIDRKIEQFASGYGHRNIMSNQQKEGEILGKNLPIDKSLGDNTYLKLDEKEDFSSNAFHRYELRDQDIEKKFSFDVLGGNVPGYQENFSQNGDNLYKNGYYALTKTYDEKHSKCNKYINPIKDQPMFDKPQVK